MTQAKLREQAAEMTKGMNLVDMKFYPGNGEEVAEVVLKYHAPSGGPEPLSGGIFQGRIRIDEDATA